MNKILKVITGAIVCLFFLCCFSFVIYLASHDSDYLGVLSEPIREFATFPITVKNVLASKEIRGIPPTYIPRDDGTSSQDSLINNLNYDLYGLISYHDPSNEQWALRLFNFRNDSTIHRWYYMAENFTEDEVHNFDDSKPKHSLLFDDKSLVMSLRQTRNLTKIDSNSNVVWTNDDFLFHHSLAFDADSSIWVCSTKYSELREGGYPLNYTLKNVDGAHYSFRDDQITKVDPHSGEVIFNKSITDIFVENNMDGIIFGMERGFDPVHLNDIQPALSDSEYWKKGDLFISLRNRSLVMQYRPSTNEIITIIQGPLITQHDVDFFSDHELSIFNNNYAEVGLQQEAGSSNYDAELRSSEIIIYDFETDSFRTYHNRVLDREKIYTPTGGLHKVLSNGDLFIDLDDFGRIFIVDEDSIKYRRIFPTKIEGYKHLTNWTRVYESLKFE